MDLGTSAPREAQAGLGWRLAIALTASAAAGIGADRVLAGTVDSFALRALFSAAVSAALVGVALWRLVVIPLARSRQDLHERYQAALADSLSDPLTGLGNHRAFQEELDRQVEAAHRYELPLALVIVDLDEFKRVNDGSGHAFGDRTLAHFGSLVDRMVRRADRAFRIGGDEFAILLPHTDADGARVVVRRLLGAALQPVTHRDGEPTAPISFSAGISGLPELAATRAQLYTQADSAMYQAKRAGRTEVVVFDPAAAAPSVTPADEIAVGEVIARGLLRPVYQPIVELSSNTVLGVEGLIRPVPPAPFADPGALFRAAAASGHTVGLDLSCVEAIAAGARLLPDGQFLSINLSPLTVQSPEFSAATFLAILNRHGIAPERVVIELTEQEEVSDPRKLVDRLLACRAAGVRLAADDVGAGNAGLRLLSELRFDIIKVDLGLVRRSAASATSSAVIESVVSLAARTGAMVVGEGIEVEAQVSRLASLGVVAGQGYLLGRPGPLAFDEAAPLATPALAGTAPLPHPAVAAGRPGEQASPVNAWRQSIGLPVS